MNLIEHYAAKLNLSAAEVFSAAGFLKEDEGWIVFRWNEALLGARPSAADLAAIDALPEPAPTVAQLADYAKVKRDATEASGITVNGVAIASDTDSQSRVNNAYNGMLVAGVASIPFKSGSGFVTLSLDQVKAIGTALFAHTQACFSAEDQIDAALSASPPTITSFAEIDALFAAVKSAY